MVENDESRGVMIRLVGLQPGASEEKLALALQRIYKGKKVEELRRALMGLPLILARKATEEQAAKIKSFLESQGAIVKISTAGSPGTRELKPASSGARSVSEQESAQRQASYTGEERRSKPRVSPGIQLYPMGIGEILDRSFRILRSHFWLLFLIILIPQAIYFLVGEGLRLAFYGGAAMSSPAAMGIGFGFTAFFSGIIFLIIQFWAQGALVNAVSETYLGHSTRVMASYGAMRSRLGRLIGTLLLMGILIGIVVGVVFVISFVGAMISGVLTALLGFVAVVLGLHLFLNWLMTDKVVVLEGEAWMSALRRSKELMTARTEEGYWKSTKMKASLILLLGFLIGIGIHLLFQLPGAVLGFLAKGNVLVITFLQILNIAATSLVTVYTATAMILYYYDIRVRKEGFDLKMMAEKL
jgi:hypothetical protein